MSSKKLVSRLTKELKSIKQNPPHLCSADIVSEDNIKIWNATIIGPEGTPYENGIFKLIVKFSNEYPLEPPKIKFLTRIYHPNINRNGRICLDILKKKWSPALTIEKVLLSLCSLLADPNPEDPLVPEIGRQFTKNRELFNKNALEYTTRYAK